MTKHIIEAKLPGGSTQGASAMKWITIEAKLHGKSTLKTVTLRGYREMREGKLIEVLEKDSPASKWRRKRFEPDHTQLPRRWTLALRQIRSEPAWDLAVIP